MAGYTSTPPALLDFGAIKARQQRAWASGDFPAIGALLVVVGELLCDAAGIRAGQQVLDVATGTGNTALAAARRFGVVTGVDYVPLLLERARERAVAERLPVAFREGDAEALPFHDGTFDVVLSTFGVMFAPDQERAAAELLRVCRHGGTIGLANWVPSGFSAAMSEVTGRYAPAPPGLRAPHEWGTEARLRELLGGGIGALRIMPRTFLFRHRSIQGFEEFLRRSVGMHLQVFEALSSAEREQFVQARIDVIRRFNQSGDESVLLPNEYIEAVAVRR